MLEVAKVTHERRERPRFPIQVPVKYFVYGHEGFAVTRDISSHGVFIKAAENLRVGERVELFLNWPAVLDGHELSLKVTGRVIRSISAGAAISISKHEFRLRRARIGTPWVNAATG